MLERAGPDRRRTADAYRSLRDQGFDLVTHNCVIVEAAALAHTRLGLAAARTLLEDVLAPVTIEWVDEDLHRAAVGAFLAAGRRQLSLVDCVSFELMRRLDVDTAFTLDRDFRRQGFKTVP